MSELSTFPEFELHSSFNGSPVYRRLIGFYVLDEPTEFTQMFDCAAWHRTGVFPAGSYPVYQYKAAGRRYCLAHLSGGEITSACFVSRLGSSYGSDRGSEEVGREFDYSVSIGCWVGENSRVSFADGIEVKTVGEYSDGRPMIRAYADGQPIAD